MNPVRTSPRRLALAVWRAAEHAFDRVAGEAGNPLRHLGAVGFLFFWLLAGTGAVLFALLDTSVEGAYRSVAQLGFAGALARGLHRYAADAFVVTMVLHLVREWLHGRYAHFRRFSWLTGVPLLVLASLSGIGGFWLGWDRLAQFSATATAEWLDALGIFASPFTRNFIADARVSDRLFSLLVFVHLGVALFIVFALWAHLQRLARAEVFPPRPLAWGTMAALLVLALVLPVVSGPVAALAQAPDVLALDWWLLWAHPLMYAWSPAGLWVGVAAVLAALVALPLLTRIPRASPARVDLANCNGCRRCFDDCPYEAIEMVPHPLRPRRQLAVVDAARCAGCGVCTGACPSSTPLRRIDTLVTGIDMPQQPIDDVRRELRERLQRLDAPRRIAVFGCAHAAPVPADADVASLQLLCTGMLPPAFVDLAFRLGADAVLVAGCRSGGCEFRHGMRWTRERLTGLREPRLRAAVPRGRVAMVEADREEGPRLRDALDRLRALPAHGGST